ncbi:MAG: flagellar export protein FliJ [Acidobacteria bacterium]|nr:flagellar export protein FliJ [Acidobacteriota bacterium]
MKRFKFSLQTLHDLREQERETAERELGKAIAAVAEATAKIEALLNAIVQAVAAHAANLRVKEVNAREAQMHTEYIATLEQQLAEARACHAALEREREVKLQELIKASAAAEATAKLREQYYARYISELAREEQNLMDELATIATVRRLQGAS